MISRINLTTYPIFKVSTSILQQVFKLNYAVGHKVIVANWRIMKDRQFNFLPVVNLSYELVVPRWAVSLLLS